MIYHLPQEIFSVHNRTSHESLKVQKHTLKPVMPLHWKAAWPYFGAGKQTGVFYIPDTLDQDTGVSPSEERWSVVGGWTPPLQFHCLFS